jgi:hypothetical protein
MNPEASDGMPPFSIGLTARSVVRATWLRAWRLLRPGLGWLCLAVGMLGMILPVLPGIPILLLGVALVGRRNRLLRWAGIQEKRLLRHWSRHPAPLMRGTGRWLLRQRRQIANQLRRRPS